MKTIHPNIAATVQKMHQLLMVHKGNLRCAGCDTQKPASPLWGVGAFQPFAPGKKAGVYLLCPACATTKESRDRAALYVETALREMEESGVSQ